MCILQADDDARPLLDRYFQSVVRAAANPAVSSCAKLDGEYGDKKLTRTAEGALNF